MKTPEVDYILAYRKCMNVTLHNMRLGRLYNWNEVCRIEMEDLEAHAAEREAYYRQRHPLTFEEKNESVLYNPRMLFYDNI